MSAKDRAAVSPAGPPPTTRADWSTGAGNLCSGASRAARATGHADQVPGLVRGRRVVGCVHPGTLVADVGHFKQVRVQPGLLQCFLKKLFVGARRTGKPPPRG